MIITVPSFVTAAIAVGCLAVGSLTIVVALGAVAWKLIGITLKARGDFFAAVWFICHRRRMTTMIDEIMQHERMRRGDFHHELSEWMSYRQHVAMFADDTEEDDQ